MLQLNGHRLAAIDFETTGILAGYHEPIQVALVLLGPELRPVAGVPPFYTLIKPMALERADPGAMQIHRIPIEKLMEAPEPWEVAERLVAWQGALGLPFGKRLIPLAHSWPFESNFLDHWLGLALKSTLFERDARDTRATALAMNDLAIARGQPLVFPKISLGALCEQLGVVNNGAHDALWDAVAEAEVYRRMLES